MSQSNRWLRPGLVGPGFLREPSPPPGSLFLHGLVPGLKAQNPVLVVNKNVLGALHCQKIASGALSCQKSAFGVLGRQQQCVQTCQAKHCNAKQNNAKQNNAKQCKAMQSNAKQSNILSILSKNIWRPVSWVTGS